MALQAANCWWDSCGWCFLAPASTDVCEMTYNCIEEVIREFSLEILQDYNTLEHKKIVLS